MITKENDNHSGIKIPPHLHQILNNLSDIEEFLKSLDENRRYFEYCLNPIGYPTKDILQGMIDNTEEYLNEMINNLNGIKEHLKIRNDELKKYIADP